jgi:hypothetical protein
MWSWEMPHEECREASALAKHEVPANDALFYSRPTKPCAKITRKRSAITLVPRRAQSVPRPFMESKLNNVFPGFFVLTLLSTLSTAASSH